MTDSDRALLEAAARAAGWEATRVDERGWFYVQTYSGEPKEWELWNPLEDDGDALRLLVTLRLDIEWRNDGRLSCFHACGAASIESVREDVNANLRRAITRAAASMEGRKG